MPLPRFLAWLAAGLVALSLFGCAHPISMSPDLGRLKAEPGARIDRKVGLVVTEADRAMEVTGPGGGGDKVSYFPYRDLEAGLYVALSETFANVTRLAGSADPKVAAEGLHFVITPRIVTTSYSPSLFTWPPTVFTVELSCKVSDGGGRALTEVRVLGDGRAEFEEFKGDFSLSARRASEDALRKLMKALASASALRGGP